MRGLDDLDVRGQAGARAGRLQRADGQGRGGRAGRGRRHPHRGGAWHDRGAARNGARRLVLVSHLGRPEGRREEDLSMAPVVARLRELTDANVTLAPAVVGEEVRALTEKLARRRGAGARERALRARRDEQRPRLRTRAGGAGGRVRQRRVRGRAPRAREHRGCGASASERGRDACWRSEVGRSRRSSSVRRGRWWRWSAEPRWRTRSP